MVNSHKVPGVLAALTAAILFGASTPLAKLLLGVLNPWLLAGLLYLGSGLGLLIYCGLKAFRQRTHGGLFCSRPRFLALS
ncbi:EamA family transporter [uncultured Thiothrix sp.]|uniref:EamA family transporter n=1 Tax=uncultured Thiothrix sp. TaxID=223185 RepID=UPI00261B41B2|nr:EamA family transporter [uncultured Thiothrix sp.]HMT92303.1 EamA family transporter [Thiolinea sp.]